jgi:hypothetical protein
MRTLPLLFVVVIGACRPPYEPPTPEMPNAIVKFRRTYRDTPGVRLTEGLDVDRQSAFRVHEPADTGNTPRTDAVLVHPGDNTFEVSATFTHTVPRTRQQSYSCGTPQYPRTCSRTVTEQVTVVDGRCAEALRFTAEARATYLIELDYRDPNSCSVNCYVQTPDGAGGFANSRCRTQPLE